MILQENMSFGQISEVGPVTIFTVSYQCIEHLGVAFVFHDLYPVQLVFYMVAVDDHHGRIEIVKTEIESTAPVGWDQVI